jgi:hypothetical protein
MQDALSSILELLTPPQEAMLGPRRLLAWLVIASCLTGIRVAVRILPRNSPMRIFLDGTTQTLREAARLGRFVAAPAPDRQATLRGS